MNNKINTCKILLEANPDTLSMLKEMIIEKNNELEEIKEVYALLKDYEQEKLETFDHISLQKCLMAEETKTTLSRLERDLHNMVSSLWVSSNMPLPEKTLWDEAYRKATSEIEIEYVISHFLGELNFRRNIRCPFHKDQSPSLKVYSNSNRFVCFGCGAKGSSIDFVIKYKECSFKEAVHILSNL